MLTFLGNDTNDIALLTWQKYMRRPRAGVGSAIMHRSCYTYILKFRLLLHDTLRIVRAWDRCEAVGVLGTKIRDVVSQRPSKPSSTR